MIKKVYSSKCVSKQCDNLLASIKQKIIKDIMQKHNQMSFEEAYLLFVRSLDTQKIKSSIIETSLSIKQDFRFALTN